MLYVNRGGGKRERRKVDLHSNFFKHLINKTAITPQKGYFAIKLKQPHGPFQTKKKIGENLFNIYGRLSTTFMLFFML